MTLKYFSVASGIAGFERALKDHEIVGYSEIDKDAISVYEKHFPNHKNYGDFTKIDYATLPDFDIAVGGLPCQPYSICGNRFGADDERDLFGAFYEMLKVKKPRMFIVENVPGMMVSGGSIDAICTDLCSLGYEIDVYTVDASDCGVPQKRIRIFICGRYHGKTLDGTQYCIHKKKLKPKREDHMSNCWRDIRKRC